MSNNLRTRNGMPFNFVNGLKVRGQDIESLIPGIEGIPEAGSKYQFAGNGVNKVFTLPVTPYNKDAIEVHVKQLYVHSTDYTLVGDTITLAEAPPAVVVGETYNVEIKVNLTVLNGYVNANRVSYEGENLDTILAKYKPLANYSNLRSYAGAATQIRITDPGIDGFFYYDPTDTTSADNGGTVIVQGSTVDGNGDIVTGTGKRWKRQYNGDVNITWFLSSAQLSDVQSRSQTILVTSAVQSAVNATSYGGTLNINTYGTFLVDTLTTAKSIADLGSNWSYGAILINKPIKIIGNKSAVFKIKNFSTAWAAMDIGDSITAFLIKSSFVHIDGVNIDANGKHHYESSDGFKYWETGPTLKRPPCGFTITCEPDQDNVTNVLIENCTVTDPLAGIYFFGNALDTRRVQFMNGSLKTGVVKDCVSRNNRIEYGRGNGIIFNMGVDNCISFSDVFVNLMYHAVRMYSRAINCRAVSSKMHVDCDDIISRYNATDLGYWRSDNTSNVDNFKISRSGFHIGGADSYSATYGYSVKNCGFENCEVTFKRSTSFNYVDYYLPSALYMGAFTATNLPGSYIKGCRSYSSDYGIVLYKDTIVTPADPDGVVVTGNIINTSGVVDMWIDSIQSSNISNNTIVIDESRNNYSSVYLKNYVNGSFVNNQFCGTPQSAVYAVIITGDTTNLRVSNNDFPSTFSYYRRYAQEVGSTPICPFPDRVSAFVGLSVIGSAAFSNGWAVAYGAPAEGQDNQLRILPDSSVQICLRLSGAGATSNTVATLVSNLRPPVTIGFTAHERSTGVSYWGRVLTDGRIQINLPTYPAASAIEVWADIVFSALT